MALKLGVSLPQSDNYDPRTDVVEAARTLEEIGFDSLWVYERITYPVDQSGAHGLYGVPGLPWPEVYRGATDALVTLTAAAAVTERVQLGTCVLVPPLHLPYRLARTLATIDAISGGRLIAGLGTGWSVDEYAAAAPRPIEERGAALDEFLDIAEAVWGPNPVSFHTERYSLEEAVIGPKPARRIPVFLAAFEGKALDRIARRADGWIPTGLPPEKVASTLRELREKAAEYGRDPKDISCTVQISVSGTKFKEVPSAGREPYTGNVAQIVEDLATLAEAGVDHVLVTVPYGVSGQQESLEVSAELYAQARAAGI